MRIARLLEEPDWRDVLSQIDDIFFATSAVQTFRDDQHRASFKVRWLGRYLEHFTNSFFIARDEDGTIAGYLAGWLDNPLFTPLFNHRAPGLHVITDKGPSVRFYEQNGFRTLAVTRWSGTEVAFMGKELKISRNTRCPCGSGKK